MKYLIAVLLVISTTLSTLAFIKAGNNKIAVVRTGYALEFFNPMIEANEIIQEKEKTINAKINTLNDNYIEEEKKFIETRAQLSTKQEQIALEKLKGRRAEIEEFRNVKQRMLAEEVDKITQGALNQFNDFVQVYARENKIKVVIGSNITANVLYAHTAKDITDDIIAAFNE